MKRKRRVEITVETRLLLIRRSKNQPCIWCLACCSLVQAVTPEVAAALASANARAIYRWGEAGELHFIETIEQAPLICLNSLFRLTDKGENNHVAAQFIDHCKHD